MGDDVFVVPEKVFKVDVDSGVVDGFTAFADAMGMKNKAVAERLLRYFLAQPDAVRRYMIGLVQGDEATEIARFHGSLGKIEPKGSRDLSRGHAKRLDAARKQPPNER